MDEWLIFFWFYPNGISGKPEVIWPEVCFLGVLFSLSGGFVG